MLKSKRRFRNFFKVFILDSLLKSKKSYFCKTDRFLWISSLILSIYSLLLLFSVSKSSNFNYFKTHLASIAVGYLGAFFITKIGYKSLSSRWYVLAAICLSLMLSTFFVGVSITGNSGVDARAWIKLPGNVTFQPSEFAKIGFIITFSKHLDFLKNKEKLNDLKYVILICLHAAVPMALAHLQGDDGATVIFFFMFLIMCYVAGIKLRYFFALFLVMLISLPYLWNNVLADYQKQRLVCQLNLEADPLGMGFQQLQGKISIGSGKIFGLGLFKGERVANGAVPIQHSDFIFSAIGEELGFIGCILAISLLLFLILRTMKISSLSSDLLGSIICFGFLGIIISQTIFNLGMCLSLLPVMGVTLPFFSAGGSSVACLYLGLGLVQSVYAEKALRAK